MIMNNDAENFKDLKILYFSDAGPKLSVFASQTVGMYKAWSKICRADLIYRHKGAIDSEAPGRAIKQVGSLSRLLLHREIKINNLKNLLYKYDVIHCRGAITVWMAIKSLNKKQRKKCKILYDCRGLASEEMAFGPARFFKRPLDLVRYFEKNKLERQAVTDSDIFLTVSSEMSEYFTDKYNRSANLVIPTIVDGDKFKFSNEIRNQIRARLGLQNKRVFLYVGGIDHWQRLDLLGDFWIKHILQNPDDTLLVLTKEKNAFISALGIEIDKIKDSMYFDYVPYEKVPGYMFAADYGIMFRDTSIINRVASPVKLNEYLAAGLTVITNQEFIYKRAPDSMIKLNTNEPMAAGIGPINDNDRQKKSIENSKKYGGEEAVRRILKVL